MVLSRRVVETLIDLVEIKLSLIEVHDREDSRELAGLEQCRSELQGLVTGAPAGTGGATAKGAVAAFAKAAKGRRPRAAVTA